VTTFLYLDDSEQLTDFLGERRTEVIAAEVHTLKRLGPTDCLKDCENKRLCGEIATGEIQMGKGLGECDEGSKRITKSRRVLLGVEG
jgi:hypothetical protein